MRTLVGLCLLLHFFQLISGFISKFQLETPHLVLRGQSPKSGNEVFIAHVRTKLSKTIASLTLIAGSTLAVLSGSAYSTDAAESTASKGSQIQQYLDRTIDFAASKKSMALYQGFAINKGRAPARGGGDRTGAFTWPGGVELASLLLRHSPIDVSGKRVIDLGTGTGVAGIAAVWAGASEVALTDGAREVLEICTLNVNRNIEGVAIKGDLGGVVSSGKVAVGTLKWGDKQDIERWLQWQPDSTESTTVVTKTPTIASAPAAVQKDQKYDVVIATEVAYQRKSIDILISTIKQLVKPRSEGGVVMLRLTPELTDDARGLEYLMQALKQSQLELIQFPDIGEDNSQLLQLASTGTRR